MEGLLVDGVDRNLRRAKEARIIERPHLQDHGRQTRPPCGEMRAAFGAKLPRHRFLKIAPRELLGRALRVAKAFWRHEHEHVWSAPGNIPAFTAVALGLERRFALGHLAHLPTIV